MNLDNVLIKTENRVYTIYREVMLQAGSQNMAKIKICG